MTIRLTESGGITRHANQYKTCAKCGYYVYYTHDTENCDWKHIDF